MPDIEWTEVGKVDVLKRKPLQEAICGRTKLPLSYRDGSFPAISGTCNHVGGLLGEGALDDDYIVCPWH